MHERHGSTTWLWATLVFFAIGHGSSAKAEDPRPLKATAITASSTSDRSAAAGACDGDRFAANDGHGWQGAPGDGSWWWQIDFGQPMEIGAILQVIGDGSSMLTSAPSKYTWQISLDGASWSDLAGTAVENEQRAFRVHRLKEARKTRYLRLRIDAATGKSPTLREVEVYVAPDARIEFPAWAVIVDTEGLKDHRDATPLFMDLAHSCEGWDKLQSQTVRLTSFNEAWIGTEPTPLCAFLTGNFSEWCQQPREPWRGMLEVLTNGRLPMWASCGGAQGLALLSDVGVDKPWDCPRCRDAANPKSPIYTHIGHTGDEPCGSYKHCLFERGPTAVRPIADDPALVGLPKEFQIVESHCGQIDYVPRGWTLIVTKGKDGKTATQCMRRDDRPIYAAQFHIEMKGTPESSKRIMANFLAIAQAWGGYNPRAKAIAPPTPLAGQP